MGVIAAKVYLASTSTIVALLSAIAIALLFYAIMGFAHVKLSVPSFIVTLGFLSIARAVVTMVSSGQLL